MQEYLALLLPIAFVFGWWLGQNSVSQGKKTGTALDPTYFKGLNYLLNEQPDKAIDLFIELLKVDVETVETLLALGSLFRRRGEVDRAIRIHQSLLDRATLGHEQHAMALLEMGQDYMRAGLFDRAEALFGELANIGQHQQAALLNLKEIYQQEKDWERCLTVAKRLEAECGLPQGLEIAHYYCEQAEEALKTKQLPSAWELILKAAHASCSCVRTTVLRARIEQERHNYQAAIEQYRLAIQQDADIITEVMPSLLECCRNISQHEHLADYLNKLYLQQPDSKILLALVDLLRQANKYPEAKKLLYNHLQQHTDMQVLEKFIIIGHYTIDDIQCRNTLNILQHALHRFLESKPTYVCSQCGFSARQMHWHCPGCKGWGTIRSTTIGSLASHT